MNGTDEVGNITIAAINLMVFALVNIAICIFSWKKSNLKIGIIEFFNFSFNLREKFLYAKPEDVPLFDHPDIKSARMKCVIASIVVMVIFSVFYV